MPTTWYLYLLIAAGLVGVAILLRRPLLDRVLGLAPTQPADPDETDDREESGADPEYPEDLRALAAAERDLQAIAEELGLDLLNPDQAQDAEAILALRLSFAELVDHFDGRVERILDDWEPGWWEEPSTPLPTFGAVHALIEDTCEMEAVPA